MRFTINKRENNNGDILILHDNIAIQAFTYERNKDYRDTYIEHKVQRNRERFNAGGLNAPKP